MSDDGMTVKTAGAPPAAAQSVRSQQQRAAAPVAEPQAAPKMPAAPKVPDANLEAVARQLESFLKGVSRSLEFHVDSASGRMVCSVRDAQTGDLIRQIPNEEILRLAELAQDETIVLVDERA